MSENTTLGILALEPYLGGSHQAFLQGWSERSRHTWHLLGLPPRKWKWRMRHAALTFADQLRGMPPPGRSFQVIVCSDMLDLATFRGLAPPEVADLPAVVYFHENQLTYPRRHEDERDYHFGFINMTSCLAADAVWFNSEFHREAFIEALERVLSRMPDHRPPRIGSRIMAKSRIEPPGITAPPLRSRRPPGPFTILWAARWEHDKRPELFFEALDLLDRRGIPFRLNVIGERFRDAPEVFARARRRFARHIHRFGFQRTLEDYHAALWEADVIVSTADHEFFGIGVLEAVAAGAQPLVPRRLAYPEVLAGPGGAAPSEFFHDETAAGIASALERLYEGHRLRAPAGERARVEGYFWDVRAPAMDEALLLITRGNS